ncbi:histidine phosphatase family protein [Pseudonocardia pini]|uniref:histidine phosphatase family protein n=1 Tax=Pseudonocardia pini TaxID=2758030 RepID=UPI0015EFE311|nr:histidine phosphatase family protein [Pseudonocardia pini]
MELLLIRHARPHGARAAAGEQPDPDLSPVGIAQAEALAQALAAEPLEAIYTSTMVRARRTAVALGRLHRLTPCTDPDLVELTLGEDRYVPLDTRGSREGTQQEFVDRFAHRSRTAEGAATIGSFRERVEGAVDRIRRAHPGQAVAVVCHGGVINAVLTRILGIDELMTFHPDYTSISRVLISRTGARQVISVNEHGHTLALERAARVDLAEPAAT